ncbi:MAG: hypothetical protein KF889_04030 [Alphaproteobacteria bacterium]|nr:hypothetical protein [Alphaproteobacteria bacterium]MCW5744480.1 hypothetical protein [Alphaproteobacteria bacterium]
MAAPREAIVALCKKLLPETTAVGEYVHWHEIGFDNLAKDYGQGMGTTCGFLPHWLLWRFGCRDNTLVNRSSPPEGLTYRIGANLSIFQPTKAQPRPSWIRLDEQKTRDAASGRGGPKPGDFVIIRGGFWLEKSTGERTRDSAHIFVLLDVLEANGKTVKWRVAQSGVSNNAFQQGAHITTLTGELREGEVLEANTQAKGPNLVFVANILGEEPNFPRRVIGYVDIDKIGFGAGPSAKFTQLFENRFRTPTTNDITKVNQWFGWYEMASAGGFIALNKPYLLLHRGHEAYRLEKGLGRYACSARGMWTLTGNKIDIVWEDTTPDQSWTMATSYTPRTKTAGVPVSGNAGEIVRVAEIPKTPSDIMMDWRVA